jgi:hypothetical protein
MECPECEAAARKPHHGVFSSTCPRCCARLIAQARPNRALQEALLEALVRGERALTREAILEALKEFQK